MDSVDYQNKINTLVLDKNTYKEIKTDPTDKYTKQLRKELAILKDKRLITPQIYRKFYPKGCSVPKFYGLPKIHKKDTPLRPIVASYSFPAIGVGRFLATIFMSLPTTQKSYIKNSIDLVEKLKNHSITEKNILSNFDAVSMYTSCDFHKCEQALQRKLEENLAWPGYKTLEIDTIMTLVRFCNRFLFIFYVWRKTFPSGQVPTHGHCFVSFFGKFLHEFHRTICFE